MQLTPKTSRSAHTSAITDSLTSGSTRNGQRSFGRRSFLVGSGIFGAGAVLGLAGCGGGSNEATTFGPQLVALFSTDHVIAAGVPQRLPFGLVDQGQPLVGESGDVVVQVMFNGDLVERTTIPSRIVTHDHPDGNGSAAHEHADILRYFAVRTILPEPGIYDLVIEIDGATVSLPVQAFAAEDVRVLLPGEAMPAIETPTFEDARGVDPLCTRAPDPCPFHDQTLASILDEGRPVAVLVSTPAVCATAYCGPVLEALVGAADAYSRIAMVHIEVYANAGAVGYNLADPDIELAPALIELGLEFEPSLFLVNSSGIIVERIDNVYDSLELQAALDGLH